MTTIAPSGSASSLILPKRSYASIPEVLEVPNLVQVQLDSFQWFKDEGLSDLFEEISPISDFTGNRMDLRFLDFEFRQPKFDVDECRERDMTFAAPLFVRVELLIKETGEKMEQSIFMGDFPLMTYNGTFVINGAERVVVSQLVRSPGVYFTIDEDPTSGRRLAFAKLIPNRGAWLEFETSNRDVLSVKVDRRRKVPITTLLRSIGYGQDEDLFALFHDIDTNADHQYLRATMDREPAEAKTERGALMEFYRRLRPGDPPNEDNARGLVQSLFFNRRRYDLGRVGRYKLNKRLGLDVPEKDRILTKDDLIQIVRELVKVNNHVPGSHADDIDHLGNRRIRAVGELIQNQFRIGLLRIERVIRERMTIIDPTQATPSALVNIRPVVAAIKEFFGGSQLSQFMDQTNPLAELTHKRRLSALGPGGLSRDRAGFDVRDVHYTHYGRICPIETPEGPNIGLIGSLATFGRVNSYGFIETPYRRVVRELSNSSDALLGHTLREDVKDAKGKVIFARGAEITPDALKKLRTLPSQLVRVVPYVSAQVDYLSADQEEQFIVAQANSRLDERGRFRDVRVEARHGSQFLITEHEHIQFMDVSPKQIFSVATSLIPFLEHDDANRALMGSNMQRQAVPLLKPQAPLVSTGMEFRTALDSGQVVCAPEDGIITTVDARHIAFRGDSGKDYDFPLTKFMRSNQGTCINQRVLVDKGDRVVRGQPLADSSSTDQGDLALGQNVLVAFMSWEGYNFEDAIIISEKLVQDDKFSSIHIEKHEIEARDTKLGPEEITRDIPNVGEESLRDLDEEGIIRVGAEVGPGDILVGKITPKGETELTAEEKLLRAIFGEKAREVKDTSLRVPHGEHGKIIDVKVFSREEGHELPAGVNRMVRVSIAQRRKISQGDKMAGRHGNKGVIARILPVEDMPHLVDGTPVEIVLNPLGVPSRMNVGQVLETHLGAAAEILGFRAITPVFDGATSVAIEDAFGQAWIATRASQEIRRTSMVQIIESPAERIAHGREWLQARDIDPELVFGEQTEVGGPRLWALRLWLVDRGISGASSLSAAEVEAQVLELMKDRTVVPPIHGKATLYDGRTGEPFDQPVTVGQIYMLKLVHLVEDKIHARSTGPYSLITQQPLGGKAQFGGQRFGEMEVWALEAYGAAHILQELLTVKSDDVVGRVKTYEAIVKGEDIMEPGVPESFKVLVKELQSLGLSIEVLNEDEEQVALIEDMSVDERPLGLEGIDITGWEKGEG